SDNIKKNTMPRKPYSVAKPANLAKRLASQRLATSIKIMRTDETGKPIKNVLLLAIPEAEFSQIRPHLDFVELPHAYIFAEPGEKLDFACFLNFGMTSLVVSTKGGRSCEIGIVGKEGAIGAPLAVGIDRVPYQAIMQIPGHGLRIRADILEDILDR